MSKQQKIKVEIKPIGGEGRATFEQPANDRVVFEMYGKTYDVTDDLVDGKATLKTPFGEYNITVK